MLEFENDQVPVKAEVDVKVNEGFVMLPLVTYNELLLAAEGQYIPVKVCKESWNAGATIVAEVDKDWLLSVASELLKQRYSAEELAKYELVSLDDIYTPSITIATRKPPETEAF